MDHEPGGPLRIAAHAVIADRRGRLLLLRRPETSEYNPGRWEFPGGKIDQGEGIQDALVREAKEETGLAVRPGRLLGAGDQERREGRVVHLILGAISSGDEVLLSDEHDAFRWVTPKGLAELPLSDWMEGWYRAQGE